MTYFTLASDENKELLAEAMRRWHAELNEQGVRVEFILASREDLGPAVRHGGYPALATIRVVPLKDRLTKGYDAELVVDDLEFNRLSTAGKMALLDHELTHLELKRSKTGVLLVDDLGRPKLRARKGDWNAGDGFAAVVQRHGEQAIEFSNLRLAYGRAQAAADKASEQGKDES